jgi:acyl carrier protein
VIFLETQLLKELRDLIFASCDLDDLDPAILGPDDPLFGPDSPLELDSVDALEIVVALQKNYGDGVRIADRTAGREILRSLQTIHDFVAANRTQ